MMTNESYARMYLKRHYENLGGEYETEKGQTALVAEAVEAGDAAADTAMNEDDVRRAIEGPLRAFIQQHKPPIDPREDETARRLQQEAAQRALQEKRDKARKEAADAEREIEAAQDKLSRAGSVIEGHEEPVPSPVNAVNDESNASPEEVADDLDDIDDIPLADMLPDLADSDHEALGQADITTLAQLREFFGVYETMAEVEGLSAKAISELDAMLKEANATEGEEQTEADG